MSITLSTIGRKLIKDLPTPLALAWNLVMRANSSSERIRLCWNVIEIFLRYTAGLSLACYLRDKPNDTVEKILTPLQKPSLGHYCAVIREILRLSHKKEESFLYHIASWYFTEKGKPSQQAQNLDYLISLRNDDNHGWTRTSSDLNQDINQLLAIVEKFLYEAKWLHGYSLHAISNPTMLRSGGFEGNVFRFHGSESNIIPLEMRWSCILFPSVLYVCDPTGKQFLEVAPFLYFESGREDNILLWISIPKWKRLDVQCERTGKIIAVLPHIKEQEITWDVYLERREEIDPILVNEFYEQFSSKDFFEEGTILDQRYHIKSRLGEGGMAVVYSAEDVVMERLVALKVLHMEQVDSPIRERTMKEYKHMKQLSHPNILPVYDISTLSDNRIAFSMPLMEGTLKQVSEEKKLDHTTIANWGAQVLSALDFLHAQKKPIYHRDVKPSNILYNDNHVYLGDFGISKQEGDAKITRTLDQVGSLPYMSPELKNGEQAGPHTDRYALGVTLHELCTGKTTSTPGINIEGDLGIFIRMLGSDNIEERMQAQWPLLVKEANPAPIEALDEPPIEEPKVSPAPIQTDPQNNKPPPKRNMLPLIILGTISIVIVVGIGIFYTSSSNSTPQTPSTKAITVDKATNTSDIASQWSGLKKEFQIGEEAAETDIIAFQETLDTTSPFFIATQALQEWGPIAVKKVSDAKTKELMSFIEKYQKGANTYTKEIVALAQQSLAQQKKELDSILDPVEKVSLSDDLIVNIEKLNNIASQYPHIDFNNIERYKEAQKKLTEHPLMRLKDAVGGGYINIMQDKLVSLSHNGRISQIQQKSLFGCDKNSSFRGVSVQSIAYSIDSNIKNIDKENIFINLSTDASFSLVALTKEDAKKYCIEGKQMKNTSSLFTMSHETNLSFEKLTFQGKEFLYNTKQITIPKGFFGLKIQTTSDTKIFVFEKK